jgi:hypothetical protein
MFSTEYAIRARSFDDSEFSLFAPREVVLLANELRESGAANGFLRVELTASDGDLRLVRLPQEAFGVGNFATVRSEQLRIRNGTMQPLPAGV